MKLIVALLALCLLVTPAFAAPMPWTLFNEPAMLKANVFAGLSVCQITDVGSSVTEIYVAGFKTDAGEIYVMAYAPESGRIVFTYTPEGAPVPTEIGIGYVDLKTPGAHNLVPPLRWQAFQMEVHNSVCAVLFPKTL